MMAWLAEAWWLHFIVVTLLIVVALLTLGSSHPDREKRRQRRSIDMPKSPPFALALGIALALQPALKPDVAGPPPPLAPPVIVAAPIEAVPTQSEAEALAGARDDRRRLEIECLLFAVDPDRCGVR